MNPKPLNPARFQASRGTLLVDRFMTQFIKVGGALVIVTVFGIFVFILMQVLPLFQGAEVKELATYKLPEGEYAAIGADEWSELPFLARKDGKIEFVSLPEKGKITEVDPKFDFAAAGAPHLAEGASTLEIPAGAPLDRADFFTAIQYDAQIGELLYGTATGFFGTVSIRYSPTFEKGKRTISGTATTGNFIKVGTAPIVAVDAGAASDARLIAALQRLEGKTELRAVLLTRKRAGLGGGAPPSSFRGVSLI